MSSPLETPAFGNLFVGDTRDDDGPVIDSLVKEVDTPPDPVIEAIDSAPYVDIVRPGRLLTGTFVLDANTVSPVQILPFDPKRKELRLEGFSFAAVPGANDYVQIADENGKSVTTSAAWHLRHGKSHTLDNYTGPIFVFPASGIATNSFELTWVSVTE